MTVLTAAGGLAAVEIARARHPHVVFMDLKMSDLDGLEATRRLRNDPVTSAIPVIAVTASAFRDARSSALEAGCVDYIPKPVRAEALFSSLQTHLGVHFVTEVSAYGAAAAVWTLDQPRRRDIAVRLKGSVDIGDVTQLDGLARELLDGDAEEILLGQRIERLVANFDFEGLRALAESLGEGVRGD
jgi:CheY-like chemotaxis protein